MKVVKAVMLVIMLVVGLLINAFYWNSEQFSAIKQVSVYLMVLIMVYIAMHFAKRLIFKEVMWWDWLYYLGLLSILASGTFANSENENFFHWLLDIMSITFILPVLFDLKEWINKRKVTG